MEEHIVCHTDRCACGNKFHKNSEIIELPNGDLFAAWFANSRGDRGELHRETNVYGSRLPAGANTWEDARVLVDVPGRPVQPPVMFFGPDDQLWLLVTQFYGSIHTSRPFVKRSSDNGYTWSDLELLHDRSGIYLKNPPVHVDDKGWWVLGVDIEHGAGNRPGFLVIMDDYCDRPADFPILVGGDQIVPQETGLVHGHRGFRYPTPVELTDGRLRAYLRPVGGGRLWMTHSADGGITWSTATETNIPNPDAGYDVIRTRTGNLVLVDNPVNAEMPKGRNELALFLSEDDGETWPYQLTLEYEELDKPVSELNPVGRPDFTYGSLTQTQDGTIHVVYEYRRAGIKHVAITEAEVCDRSSDEPIVEEMAEPTR
ncbi:exo-alpha-sialidase [Halobacteria archaeon AArc-m2/3/4]|uniref:Exo-alpha-sialidase n=1 Tax=Natronoglomus mannanivorans TaxID=2979990 RepID=A0ABT2QKR6_9EURY|nr:exo-alpha-sialidase [Halobacteria archaeon AArc-m2/3/4]